MDWLANQDGVSWFMDAVWPRIIGKVPDARFTVVGRAPPESLIDAAQRKGYAWQFTGYVDDVRDSMRGSAVAVVPLRIGGGTRLKVFESMAMGCPVVSTTIGVEGLPVINGQNCLLADDSAKFADQVIDLLLSSDLRYRLAASARRLVEQQFDFRVAAAAFARACDLARQRFDTSTEQPGDVTGSYRSVVP
jgi:glycosyltransferase involved in cell wall biosynthesis